MGRAANSISAWAVGGSASTSDTLLREEQSLGGMPSLRLLLQRDPRAPSLARAAVRGLAEESEIADSQSCTLALLVSELVSNAVIHSDAPLTSAILLCVQVLERDTVRIEVVDGGSGFVALRRGPGHPLGGYGLLLVETQATRWGIDRAGGTRVWFELAAPAPV